MVLMLNTTCCLKRATENCVEEEGRKCVSDVVEHAVADYCFLVIVEPPDVLMLPIVGVPMY